MSDDEWLRDNHSLPLIFNHDKDKKTIWKRTNHFSSSSCIKKALICFPHCVILYIRARDAEKNTIPFQTKWAGSL
jgi:hypothetical protein